MDLCTVRFITHIFIFSAIFKIVGFLLPSILVEWFTFAANITLFLHLTAFAMELRKHWFPGERIATQGKSVLITGCDSGFGNRLAKRLDDRGFRVFASCLFPSGSGALELQKHCSERLEILELDVTRDESVQKAVEFVKNNLGSSELWAIVNNAGILTGTSAEFSGMREFQNCMEVNAYGVVRVTKAFLPFLRKSKGRVVNLCSIAGRISLPYCCPYTMSKYAAVAFSECLQKELDVWGIRVISIEPDLFATALSDIKILNDKFEAAVLNLDAETRNCYDESYLRKFNMYLQFIFNLSSENVYVVVDALESAVILKIPASTYQPCRNIWMQTLFFCVQRIPKNLLDFALKVALTIIRFPQPKFFKNKLLS